MSIILQDQLTLSTQTKEQVEKNTQDIAKNTQDIEELEHKIAGVYKFKGTVERYSDLPSTGNVTGDVWDVQEDGMNYAWTDAGTWDQLGPTVDLSGYVQKTTEINGHALSSDITLTASDVGALPDDTQYQTPIDNEHKLSSDLVDDTNAINLFVTTSEKSTWNAKQNAIDSSHKLASDLVDDTNQSHLFVSANEKSTWSGKQDALVSGDNIKTINGTSVLGSGDIVITTNYSFKDGWTTDSTIAAFLADVYADTDAVPGMSYIGELTCSDLPTGLNNAEAVVEVMPSATAATKALHVVITSGNLDPYRWELTYWVIGNTPHNSGWIAFQPKLTQGTGITINNNTISANAMVGSNGTTAGSAGIVPAPAKADNTKFLKGDGTWAAVDAFPAQSGQSGKFLTTDGSAVSWAIVDALPSQSGQSGKFLTTNGATASWSEIATTLSDIAEAGNGINFTGGTYPENYTVEGNLTVTDDYVASDFSDSPGLAILNGYIVPLTVFNPGNNPWEINCKIRTGSDVSSEQYYFQSCSGTGSDGRHGIALWFAYNSFKMYISTNGTSWTIEGASSSIVQADTTYWMKAEWNGSNYTLKYSTDGINYTKIIDVANSTPVYSSLTKSYIGCYFASNTLIKPFYGSIDLKGYNTIVNSVETWKAVGTELSKIAINCNSNVLVNTATGNNSLSVLGNVATAAQATNIGKNSTAAINSVAYGYEANSGIGATAIGRSASASGLAAVAVGYNPSASAGGAIMLGNGLNNEARTLKVALTSSATRATNEEAGLFTLMNSNGTIPTGRYITMVGADGTNAGTTGSVPAPSANDSTKFLKGNGTWTAIIDDTSTTSTTTSWSASKLNATLGDIETLLSAL